MAKDKIGSKGNTMSTDLRQKAERKLRIHKATPPSESLEHDTRALLHELQVHQIELEMQNEELQHARQAAEELSEKYSNLFDFAPVAYFLWNEMGTIAKINLAGAALLGLNRAEAPGKRFGLFVVEEDRLAFVEYLQRVMRSQEKNSCEVRLYSQGRVIDALVEAVAVNDHHHSPKKGCFAAVIDITERKQLAELAAAKNILEIQVDVQTKNEAMLRESEAQLRRAKEFAEDANQAKNHFLANISHELRTPMNSILGMIDLALQKSSDPTVSDFLENAKESADMLLTLLNDVLDSARIESGKFELESLPFSLLRLMDLTIQTLAVRASDKGLVCSYHLAPEVPDALVGDQVRLRQILFNLVGNAIKFTDHGAVEVGVRLASKRSGKVDLEFCVRDTGIGISPVDAERIFQPFAQADASTTRQYGGTGLGLSISSGLVAMMGGRIWVESKPGKGSTFHFTVRLPLAEGPIPASQHFPAVLSTAAASLKVLLAEDHPINQKLAAYLLRERGHQVDIASDGREAFELARLNQYDVILMDVQMPGMDGLEATAAIRALEQGKHQHTPIIAMTAHAMKGDRDRCLAGGMDGYLSKPINAREMFALVESLAIPAASNEASTAAPMPAKEEPDNSPPPSIFNPVLALQQCFDSREMLESTIKYFFTENETVLPQIRAALGRGDFNEVTQLGHRFKGTLVYLGAESARNATIRVECLSKEFGMDYAQAAIEALEQQCERLRKSLIAYQEQSSVLRCSGVGERLNKK